MNNILKIILDQKEYYIKVFVLFIFWKLIKKHPKFKDYKPETAFSVYRSLMCLFFMLYALENLINNFTDLFNEPYTNRECYSDITSWFIVYLIMDIFKMVLDKNTRIDSRKALKSEIDCDNSKSQKSFFGENEAWEWSTSV